MMPLLVETMQMLAFLESLRETFFFPLFHCIGWQAKLTYEFAMDMSMCKKFCCGQGKMKISLCSFTKYNLKIPLIVNTLILSHSIWAGNTTWEPNCILIYPTVKCVRGHIVKHDENNLQLCCEFQVQSTTSGYF